MAQDTTHAQSNGESLEWATKVRRQKRVCESENGVLRNLIKQAKAAGENTKALLQAIAATKQDPDTVLTDTRDFVRYASLMHIPLPSEEIYAWNADVTEKTAAADLAWDAEDQGFRAGRHGLKMEDCPFEHGTELSVVWLEHWAKGQAAIAAEMGENAKPASTSRGRPGRRKAANDTTPDRAAAAPSPGKRGNGQSHATAS
jgi:ribosome modulation factor